jgi:hypothetical protein
MAGLPGFQLKCCMVLRVIANRFADLVSLINNGQDPGGHSKCSTYGHPNCSTLATVI